MASEGWELSARVGSSPLSSSPLVSGEQRAQIGSVQRRCVQLCRTLQRGYPCPALELFASCR